MTLSKNLSGKLIRSSGSDGAIPTMRSERVNELDHAQVWQLRSASGKAIWTWITAVFTAYWILFVSGAFLGHKELNAIGGVLVLGVFGWLFLERLWVRIDAVVLACFGAAAGLPLVQLVLLNDPPSAEAVFKHVSLCMAMAAARVLNLPVVWESKMRQILAWHILSILFISFTVYRGTSWDGGTRHSGLFVNPNNLALIPFLLLFLINPVRDGKFIRFAAHGVVIAVLMYSGTSGAVLAYVIGLAAHFRSRIPRRWRSTIYATIPVTMVAAAVFFTMNGASMLPESRMTKQIGVIGGQLTNVLEGGDINYYGQERVLGPGTASGIWRVAHWRRTFTTYLDGPWLEQLIGFGFGSSPRLMGKLPHNEYLRILFEQGLVGFALFIFAWSTIIMTAPKHVRYIGLIVAIYSFSENNLDNFPFMALFVLFLSARSVLVPKLADTPVRFTAPWNTAIQPAA